MIKPEEIRSLSTVRKAIYNRQVRRCMIRKAIAGEEPYASQFKNYRQHKLKVIHQELKSLRQYRIAALRTERRAELSPN